MDLVEELKNMIQKWRNAENGRFGLDENGNDIYVLSGNDCAKELEELLNKRIPETTPETDV